MKTLNKKLNKGIRMIIIIMLIFILQALLSGCYLFPDEAEIEEPPVMKTVEVKYTTYDVNKGDIIDKITVSANFVSSSYVNLSLDEVSGRIDKIYYHVGDEVKEGEIILELETGNSRYNIKRQKLSLEKLELSYEELLIKQELEGGYDYSIRRSEIDLELARMALEKDEAELESNILRAAADGIITYMPDIEEGDTTSKFQTLARISNPDDLVLEYAGSQYSEFKEGDEVTVSYNSKEHEGYVYLVSDNIPEGISNRERKVWVRFKDPDIKVTQGDYATITLILEESRDTLFIARSLVKDINSGTPFVYIINDDKVREVRYITSGIITNTYVEVLEGLEEEDKLIR